MKHSKKFKNDIILGIDLGTTNSVLSWFMEDESGVKTTRIIKINGKKKLPSCVALQEDGSFLVGYEALKTRGERNTVNSFKRSIYKNERIRVYKGNTEEYQYITPIEASALVLKTLKKGAEEFFGVSVSDVVITVPAYFNETQRKNTLIAGEKAGWDVKKIVNEPTAATYNHIEYMELESPEEIIVYDLGGGTFDVTRGYITPPQDKVNLGVYGSVSGSDRYDITVKETGGDSNLGGDDVDAIVLDMVLLQIRTYMFDKYGMSRADRGLSTYSKNRILAWIQKCKPRYEDNMLEKEFEFTFDGKSYSVPVFLVPDYYDVAFREVYSMTRDIMKSAITDHAVVDKIVLVGGSTKSRVIRECLRKDFPETVIFDRHDPDMVVAEGAARHHYHIKKGESEVKLNDVVSLGLGVEEKGALMCYLIPKDSRVPSEGQNIFTLMAEGQRRVKIKVFQGESKFTRDAVELGTLELGVPEGASAKDYVFTVKFKVDLNGTLSITVKAPNTEKFSEISLKSAHNSVSEAENVSKVKQIRLSSWLRNTKDPKVEKMIKDAINNGISDAEMEALAKEVRRANG